MNPKTGNVEFRFANFKLIYPKANEEYSFEELRASHRGWLDIDWAAVRRKEQGKTNVALLVDVEDAPTPEDTPLTQREIPQIQEMTTLHVNPEPTLDIVSPPSIQGARNSSTKLQIHVDVKPTPSPRAEGGKAATELQIHVDDKHSSPSSSPAQRMQQKASKTFAVHADENAASQTTPMAAKEHKREALKTRTIPLKGFEDESVENDENVPPSQLEVEKAKATKKARREERSNRTRKIKVMEVKEIRNETQTSE